jgi:replicative DNA helicase
MTQVPPHNADAEIAIIGSALLYADRSLANALGIRSDEFYLPAHRDAWQAIRAAEAKTSGLVDIVSVGAEVRAAGNDARFEPGWSTWACQAATKACLPEQVAQYATMVREASAARKLILLCTELISRAYSGEAWEELLASARVGVGELEGAGGATSTIHVREAISECLDEMDRRAAGEAIETISTGIATLDDVLDGLQPGQLIVVAARPGMGKTAMACNVAAVNALRGIPCLMFSLEMAARELAIRLLVWGTKRPAKDVRHPDMAFARKVQEQGAAFCESAFWLNDRATKLEAIVSEARRWHAKNVRGKKGGKGIVFVDYAQLVTVQSQRGSNREQEVARISKTMKGLARYLEVPVFLLAQLNREVEKRGGMPILSDLRESGAIEQDADIVIFPHRDIDPADQKARNERGPAQLIVAKHRNGRIGGAEVDWIPELMTFQATTATDYSGPDTRPHWGDR